MFIKVLFKNLSFPTPCNSSIFCNIGSIIFFLMLFEFFTGIFLTFRICGLNSGVESKLGILNNSYLGYFIFKVHVIFPNIIAFLIILHMIRCFIYPVNSSFESIISGFIILVFFIAVSYTGYSLSKGSMGYWAIVVVNNLLKEVFGHLLSSSLFFNSNIGVVSDTFLKIFTYHFLLSVIIVFLQFLHIFLLHSSGSSNFITSFYFDYFRFTITMFYKDILLMIEVLLSFLFFIFSNSLFFVFGENFLSIDEFKALELSVEWYVRMFFIILRGVSFKVFGLLFTLVLLLVILLSFFINNLFRFSSFNSINSIILSFSTIIIFVYLCYLGFSSYIFLVSFFLILFLCYMLDIFFLKFSLSILKQNE